LQWVIRSAKAVFPNCWQVNRKALEGSRNPDRDAQFEHINAATVAMQAAGKPVISVDTKKKELVGDYKNGGSDYRPKGCPDKVKVHDFVDPELGKAIPYGVYDIAARKDLSQDKRIGRKESGVG
jgi:hypothetical protein